MNGFKHYSLLSATINGWMITVSKIEGYKGG